MMFLLAAVLILVAIFLTVSDPFMSNNRNWSTAVWFFLAALVCAGVGVGQWF